MVKCPYCNQVAKFLTSKEFYGKDYGTNIYSCEDCDAYVGTHRNSKTPLGTLANKELRELRKTAHKKFDRLWKKGRWSRTQAYKYLQEIMGLSEKEAHIAMFNIVQCKKLIELLGENK